jgi:hypothetical protein
MWEILAVLGLYLVVSFLGMALLWTFAARKGVPAPSFLFWVRPSFAASTFQSATDGRTTLSNRRLSKPIPAGAFFNQQPKIHVDAFATW